LTIAFAAGRAYQDVKIRLDIDGRSAHRSLLDQLEGVKLPRRHSDLFMF
jgi:hypothetical protein